MAIFKALPCDLVEVEKEYGLEDLKPIRGENVPMPFDKSKVELSVECRFNANWIWNAASLAEQQPFCKPGVHFSDRLLFG
ncbi:hypothetical protein DBIPINDM_001860 [Mesorhizobium sp. AR02]|uniref:hypothetical protein n=1 Tax=Mesorhizobium sp. AR02 TaxID=2865837 RepID=UPI00215F7450|nr:hypothetical protein [Mesorhizobium sp. AR02]UVK55353.1 hypothetical protein DBIPINDM_001860 [Mesorhizobium sp. AR02]